MEEIDLIPFLQVHLFSDQYGGMRPGGSWAVVEGCATIAALLVLVACFNFMNLATARATLRAREISLRKVVGATRLQLIAQFLGESALTALLALVVALVIVEISLPAYDRFLGRAIEFRYLAEWRMTLGIVAGVLGVGILSGIYPALVLSGFRPIAALKATVSPVRSSGPVRALLVVFQFAVSIGLGIAAIVVFSQIRFVRDLDLGFRRDGVVVVRNLTKLTPPARESLVRVLGENPQIVGTALSNAVPFDTNNTSNILVGFREDRDSVTAHIVSASPDFPGLYDIPIVAGRRLSAAYGDDAAGKNVLVNAAFVRRLGHSADQAIGKSVTLMGRPATVVGVLGDSKFDGVRGPALPAVYVDDPGETTLLSIRLRAGRTADTLAFIDKAWRSFAPNSAIERYFLSDAFGSLLESDEKAGALFTLFVGIALSVACLGLFGLAVFTADRRTKEIGIRKVFGGRTPDMVGLLLWRISIPVLIANAIAWPIAYYGLRTWLDGYAYRISLGPMYFVTASAAALAIAWGTVFVHALRLARANPVHALRYE
jgi:putative ABC transport system permease protein